MTSAEDVVVDAGDIEAVVNVSQRPPSITDLISTYGILPTLASWMSTVDLYNLGRTNSTHFAHILAPPNIFQALQRQSLCDGRGLLKRQSFSSPYQSSPTAGLSCDTPDEYGDEEIEVYLYNVKCDAAGALPCVRCGINVCKECRFYTRAAPPNWSPNRLPHFTSNRELKNIMCLCLSCDAETEKEVAGEYLNKLCDCDLYIRWVCTGCKEEEDEWAKDYFAQRTETVWYWDARDVGDSETKVINDCGSNRQFWCICGEEVPQDTPPTCAWCKRSHTSDEEWPRHFDDVGYSLPFFDRNPCYPRWIDDSNDWYPTPYPILGIRQDGELLTEPD
ncbi:hypothetical protein B0J13DRAFT_671054 [Dactylonectria estremocensis]|uniref:Uncharacterized protein n=1 Tax=Dactylonectria estremocensis TaxID=1079267 RepID=A0A9P9FF37_9HYPO|nr:hypothetical protein B0J13DRAFT_671054 [Dactylonectria estremocensis]